MEEISGRLGNNIFDRRGESAIGTIAVHALKRGRNGEGVGIDIKNEVTGKKIPLDPDCVFVIRVCVTDCESADSGAIATSVIVNNAIMSHDDRQTIINQ